MTTNYVNPSYITLFIDRTTLAANPGNGLDFDIKVPYQTEKLKLIKVAIRGVNAADSGQVWFLKIDSVSTMYYDNVRSNQLGNSSFNYKGSIPIYIHDITNNSMYEDLQNTFTIGIGQLMNDQRRLSGVRIFDRNNAIPTFTEIVLTLQAEIQPTVLLRNTVTTSLGEKLTN